jgi:hypothetical protein
VARTRDAQARRAGPRLSGLPRDLVELAGSNGEALRIGVGPWQIMEQELGALDEVLG